MPDRRGMEMGDPNRQSKEKQYRSKTAKQRANKYYSPPPPPVRVDALPERSCFAKVHYGTKAIAKDVAAKVYSLGKQPKVPTVYYCPYCHGWHLTTTH